MKNEVSMSHKIIICTIRDGFCTVCTIWGSSFQEEVLLYPVLFFECVFNYLREKNKEILNEHIDDSLNKVCYVSTDV